MKSEKRGIGDRLSETLAKSRFGKYIYQRLRYQGDTYSLMRMLYPGEDAQEKLLIYEQRQIKRVLEILLLAAVVAIAATLAGSFGVMEDASLLRHLPGGGSYQSKLEARIEDRRIPVTVEVKEQMLPEEERRLLFEEAGEELEQAVLGENESSDYIDHPLQFVESAAGGMVQVEWSFDNYRVLRSDGTITSEASAEGSPVELCAHMCYRDYEADHVWTVVVYPQYLSEEQRIQQDLEEALAKEDSDSAVSERYTLPQYAGGMPVIWSVPGNPLLQIMAMGVLLCILLLYEGKQALVRKQQERDRQLMSDYAAIVNNLYLLMAAGMSVYSAWERIVRTQEQKEETRYVYEEMRITYYQIRDGVSEGRAYEEFGKRCRLRPYLKLSAILTRNLRLGTVGIGKVLEEEAMQAFEEQKRQARRRGEEAGTKLLLPMMMLLCMVAALILIPGFMAF